MHRSHNYMKSQILDEFELFCGIKHDISLCCIIFYESVWLQSTKRMIPEYSEKMWELSDKKGVVLCPDCLVETIESNSKIRFEIELVV